MAIKPLPKYLLLLRVTASSFRVLRDLPRVEYMGPDMGPKEFGRYE